MRRCPFHGAGGGTLGALRPRRLQHRLDRGRRTPPRPTHHQADADAFPVTIEHAFGETTIEEEPTRVATLGWTDQDHALALGVVPVGATKLTWGGNDAGSSDWFDAEVEELGAEAPVRYDDADGAPDRRGRQARARPDPGHQLRHHRGGVRQAHQDRAGRRLPGGAVDHALADLARDGRQGARPQRRSPTRSRRTRRPRSTTPRRSTPSSRASR